MRHVWETHINCKQVCCPICQGGLACCINCGAAECELPTDCPGKTMTEEQCKNVCAGTLNYINGQWEQRTLQPF